ncbi:flagellar hook-associated protein FlgK [Pseudaquabacterium pictum]|uniref:Flagellar hook-associated protein 1 n=1 Tax=Pseudaquabacterium pictum TaxID=2315236 RepID=A0A480AT66_9BURK|nr:flagellar hook-associated protein FlgK [Rubrivivax pictus]GCL64889.1 flagellar hook protein FlgK [Rubrivivax pictus]
MTTTSLLSLGSSALYAANAQLLTTSNNIANANTPGYSRQSVELATAGSAYNGSGYFGRGVTVSTVTRAANMFLSQQAVATGSAAAADGVRRDMLQQLEKVFAGGEAGLGHAATQIFNAFADVAANPSDLAARQAVLGRLEDFASLVRSSSDQIEALQANLVHDVQGGLSEVNTLAREMASLNLSIAAATNRGHSPNELLDQRDELVRRIGAQMQVQTVLAPDQTMAVYVGSGQTLVLGGASFKLVPQADTHDSSRIGVAIDINGQLTQLPTEAIGEGQVAGLLRFQRDDLAEARSRLGQLVSGLGLALNDQQALGLDLSGQPGSPLFRIQGPQVLPAGTNARDGGGGFVADVGISIADPSALVASEYLLEPDPASDGQYTLTRLVDGKVFPPLYNGDTVDGFALAIGDNAPAAGESFLLKPVSNAAAGITVVLKNPRGLAAANPLTGVVNPANTGTATIAALTVEAPPAAGYQPLTLRFTDDAGNYELLDADSTPLATGTHTAGVPIRHDGVALSLNGLPRSGDRISLSPTSHPAASNGNALRFDNLANRGLIDGVTVGDAYANVLADVGVRVQGAVASADNTATVAARARAELSTDVGVNLDEEAARLIQFQQSYQAAAKMLQTAQTLFDALLASVSR